MSVLEIVLLSLALAADAFSVGAALGLRYHRPREVFRVAFHFGLFQALLALVGALVGGALLGAIAGVDHWVAFGLLAALGGRMIWSGWRGGESEAPSVDLTRGWSLVGLSLAVSIDALAAGRHRITDVDAACGVLLDSYFPEVVSLLVVDRILIAGSAG